jgi:prepilin-type N-terminal cleavage/methylation domain-containing protein
MLKHHIRRRSGFTLIELLVVIAIIALLISIILPALGKARESSRATICMGNMKEIGAGFNMYANDFKGQIWEAGTTTPFFRFWYAQPTNPQHAASASNPVEIGQAFQYLSNVDRIWACPTNKRRVPTGLDADPNSSYWQQPQNAMQLVLWQGFLDERGLNFDYTMVTGASGAPVGANALIAFDKRCSTRAGTAGRPPSVPRSDTNMQILRAAPVYMEEDVDYYNAQYPDGLYSNWDQVTNRHFGRGNAALIDGSAELMDLPKGHIPSQGSFTANDLYASGGHGPWYQVAPSWPGPPTRPYGWLKDPRP